MQVQKPSVKIENWAAVLAPNTASYESLKPGSLLVGRVYGHPRIKEGEFIFSSPIVSLDMKNQAVFTRNTVYRLGKASPGYKDWALMQGSAAA